MSRMDFEKYFKSQTPSYFNNNLKFMPSPFNLILLKLNVFYIDPELQARKDVFNLKSRSGK